MRRTYAYARALALAATFAGSALAGCASHAAPATAAATPDVRLATVREGAVVRTVRAYGRAGSPNGDVAKLSFAEAGIVRAIDVRVGQTVAAGTILAELDRAALAPQLAAARADAAASDAGYASGAVPSAAARSASEKLAAAIAKERAFARPGGSAASDRTAAQTAVVQAQLKLDADLAAADRSDRLFAAGVIARKDVDAARALVASDRADAASARAKASAAGREGAAAGAAASADVAAARAELTAAQSQGNVLAANAASARAKLDAAQVAYDAATLRASTAGVVVAISKAPGEAVDTSTAVVTIGPPATRQATLNVPARDAGAIHAGEVATLSMNGATRARGYVVAISAAVDATTQTRTVVVAASSLQAAAGDPLSATIETATVAGSIVPLTAIVEDPQSGKTVVFVTVAHPKDGEPPFAAREVGVRAQDATRAVVTGVRAGESIAASGGYLLLAPPGG